MLRTARSLILATVAALAVGSASATPTFYTSRSAWEAALGALTVETFNSLPDNSSVTAATVFPSGITVNPQSGFTSISSFAFGSIGQGTALSIVSNNLSIDLPGAPLAFGFDYEDLETATVLSFGAFSVSLALTGDADTGITPDDFAFIGVIAAPGDIPNGVFTLTKTVSEGYSIDNLAFTSSLAGVPEPGSLELLGLASLGLVAATRRRRIR